MANSLIRNSLKVAKIPKFLHSLSPSARFCSYSKSNPAFSSFFISIFYLLSYFWLPQHHTHHRSTSPARVNLYNPSPYSSGVQSSIDHRSISLNRSVSNQIITRRINRFRSKRRPVDIRQCLIRFRVDATYTRAWAIIMKAITQICILRIGSICEDRWWIIRWWRSEEWRRMGEKSAYGVDSIFFASTKAESSVRAEAKSSICDVQIRRSLSFFSFVAAATSSSSPLQFTGNNVELPPGIVRRMTMMVSAAVAYPSITHSCAIEESQICACFPLSVSIWLLQSRSSRLHSDSIFRFQI